jgi:hypothetical protein
MAAVPVTLNGVMMPKAKDADSKPVPAVFIGYLSIQGLEVGGGPIIPDNPPPTDGEHPAHPIVLPDPPEIPPVDPPPTGANVAVVLKPAPVTGGWGCAMTSGTLKWYFSPADSGAGPKR